MSSGCKSGASDWFKGQYITCTYTHTHTHKLTHTVVTDTTMGSTRRTEDLAGVAVLQLDNLVVDLHIPDAGRRALSSRYTAIGCLCKTKRNVNERSGPFTSRHDVGSDTE